jgi:hypothetical protein
MDIDDSSEIETTMTHMDNDEDEDLNVVGNRSDKHEVSSNYLSCDAIEVLCDDQLSSILENINE